MSSAKTLRGPKPVAKTKGCPPGKGWRTFRFGGVASGAPRVVSVSASPSQIQAAIDDALNPSAVPGKARLMSRGDFTPEEIKQMEALYKKKGGK